MPPWHVQGQLYLLRDANLIGWVNLFLLMFHSEHYVTHMAALSPVPMA